MTTEECYNIMNGDYKDAMERLCSDKLVTKFMLKFLNDKTMLALDEAVLNGDIEESFKAAHTLKGVSANLSFTRLTKAASELTEQLRSRENPADENLYHAVKQEYELIINTIREYQEINEQ